MMRHSALKAGMVLAAAIIAGFVPLQGQGGGNGKAAPKAGPVKRLRDGKPDMQGFWETRIDQDFLGHVVVLSLSRPDTATMAGRKSKGRNRLPDSALISLATA